MLDRQASPLSRVFLFFSIFVIGGKTKECKQKGNYSLSSSDHPSHPKADLSSPPAGERTHSAHCLFPASPSRGSRQPPDYIPGHYQKQPGPASRKEKEKPGDQANNVLRIRHHPACWSSWLYKLRMWYMWRPDVQPWGQGGAPVGKARPCAYPSICRRVQIGL